jgi:hypothetical protein
MFLFPGSTNFIIIAILTLALKGAWHFRQVNSCSWYICSLQCNIVRLVLWEKKALNSSKLLLPFLLCLVIFFFPSEHSKKKSVCQLPATTLLPVVDFIDYINWIYLFFIEFLSLSENVSYSSCGMTRMAKLFLGNVDLHSVFL